MSPRPYQSALFNSAVASLLILAVAFGFEHLGGYVPCEVCWWQRYVYMAAAPLGLLGYSFQTAGRAGAMFGRYIAVALAALFLVGGGIATYHVGVEQKWWAGPDACAAADLGGNLELMLKSLLAAPVARCDEVAWSLFGISMAGYNLLLSLGLAGYCALAARKPKKR